MDQELQALQEVIQDMHELMTILKDPQDTATVSQCLTALTRIQTKMMQPQPAQQAIASRLTGGGGGGY